MPLCSRPPTQQLSAKIKGRQSTVHQNKTKKTPLKPKYQTLQNRPPRSQWNMKSQGALTTWTNTDYRRITNRSNESCLRSQNDTRQTRKRDKQTLKLPPLAELTISELRMDWFNTPSRINRTGYCEVWKS